MNALIGAVNIHPDFGPGFGIPINVVPQNQAAVPITFDTYADESDPGPYPFPGPASVRVEGTDDPTVCDGDCHVIVVQQGTCMAYEGYACQYNADGWTLRQRREVGPEEEQPGPAARRLDVGRRRRPVDLRRPRALRGGAGRRDHARDPLHAAVHRATRASRPRPTRRCRRRLLEPTRRAADGPARAPEGAATTSAASTPMVQIFLRAFKKHGLILADNGGNSSTFYFQSEDNPSWPDAINDLKRVPVSAFEAVVP